MKLPSPGRVSDVRAAVKSRPILYRTLLPLVQIARRLGDRHGRNLARFRQACLEVSDAVADPYFVKVGANDGISHDPCSDILLSRGAWKGIFIEPVPYCVERLRANFSDSTRFALEQVAIGRHSGRAPFYFVSPAAATELADLPYYFDQVGSLDRAHVVRALGESVRPFIVESEVELCTLTEVFERNHVTQCHLLHIDVEGYDLQAIQTLEFACYSPWLIFIEHKHLSDSDRRALFDLLRRNGYRVHDCGSDYFAVDESRRAMLRASWRRA